MKKIAFLDRDGVINVEINYLHKVSDFEFTPFCIDAMRLLIDKGYEIVVVTNQAGIAKGYFTVEDYGKLTRHYTELLKCQGINLLDIKYCPHHVDGTVDEFSVDCQCRKPKPGMILNVMKSYPVDIAKSFIVGDKRSDVDAGLNAGLQNLYLVETGHQLTTEDRSKYPVFENLLQVAQHVM